MTPALERRLEAVSARHDALVAALVADPPPRAAEIARINKELARAERVVRAYAAVKERRHETASLEQVIAESAGVDAEMAQMAEDELATLEETTPALEETLAHLLLPADEADDSGVILEVRAGAGGERGVRGPVRRAPRAAARPGAESWQHLKARIRGVRRPRDRASLPKSPGQ